MQRELQDTNVLSVATYDLHLLAESIEPGEQSWRKLERGCLDVFAQVHAGGCAGDQQHVGRAVEQPRECDLHRCRVDRVCDVVERGGLQWAEATEREEGDVGDSLLRERIDERVLFAVGNVVHVLHADDRSDALRGGHLRGIHGADTEVLNEALLLELGEDGEGLGDFRCGPDNAQVDDVQAVHSEVAQVVVDGVDDLLA